MLASGSGGNSILLSEGNTNLWSMPTSVNSPAGRLGNTQKTSAVASHEHHDHIRGIGCSPADTDHP
jgi:hypothetical protein